MKYLDTVKQHMLNKQSKILQQMLQICHIDDKNG